MNMVRLIADGIKNSVVAKVDCGENELLATIQLSSGRKQTIKIVLEGSRTLEETNRIEIISRCCIAKNARMVGDALRANMKTFNGGLTLCSKSKAIDLCHRILIPH